MKLKWNGLEYKQEKEKKKKKWGGVLLGKGKVSFIH